jgi:hypothetical protein
LANRTAPWKICGRKRWGWKREFLESLAEAAKDIGEISEEENLPTVRSYRRESRAPEITVAAELEGASRGPSFDTSVLAAGISGFRESYVPCRNPSASVLHEWAEKDNFAWLYTEDIRDE